MARPIHLLVLVGFVAMIVGFAGTEAAWAQVATASWGCNGDVPWVTVGVNDNLECRVGWGRYAFIPGFGDEDPNTIDERHHGLATLKFLVDFSRFQTFSNPDRFVEVPNVLVHVEWLGSAKGGQEAKVTNKTLIRKRSST